MIAGKEHIIKHCLDFLEDRQSFLYGARPTKYLLASHFSDYDGMLKRDILYCNFSVLQRVIEAEVNAEASEFSIEIQSHAGTKDGSIRIGTYFQYLSGQPQFMLEKGASFDISLPHFKVAARIASFSENNIVIAAERLEQLFSPDYGIEPSLSQEVGAWLSASFSNYGQSNCVGLFDITTQNHAEHKSAIILWEKFSEVNIDSSGEKVPQVFRWQEVNLIESSNFSSISNADCIGILHENGFEEPRHSKLIGTTPLECDENSACIQIRYEHFIPDTDENSGDLASVPYRNTGYIIVEDEFWEYYLDGKSRKVIGGYWKWTNPGVEVMESSKH